MAITIEDPFLTTEVDLLQDTGPTLENDLFQQRSGLE